MPCKVCGGPSTLLCDGRIWITAAGDEFCAPFDTEPPVSVAQKTCDAPLCRTCAANIEVVHLHVRGHCRWDTRDLCPTCKRAYDDWQKLRSASQPGEQSLVAEAVNLIEALSRENGGGE